MRRGGFTLLELLTVVAIVALLVAFLATGLAAARDQARTVRCAATLRELAAAWTIYADQNREILVAERAPAAVAAAESDWSADAARQRPTWATVLAETTGQSAFTSTAPDTTATPASGPERREDYAAPLLRCAAAPERIDVRNFAYGYNYQFLGNARRTDAGRFVHYPVRRARVSQPAATVVVADSMGTAAGVLARDRLAYRNDGVALNELGNHATTLDPPRLTPESARGSGQDCATRTGADPRHRGRVMSSYADGHAEAATLHALGYRTAHDGIYVDEETIDDPPSNTRFSGTGDDKSPPPAH